MNGNRAVVLHVRVWCMVVLSEFRWRIFRQDPDNVCLHVPMFLHHECALLGIYGAILRKDVALLRILVRSSLGPLGVNFQV